MTRSSLLYGLFGLVGVGLIGAAPLACSQGGVGDPCIPEDEYDPQFPGFKLSLENIESRSFQCQTRICLVNHFQGRVSCPLGQPDKGATKSCAVQNGDLSVSGDQSKCDTGEDCVESVAIAQDCDPAAPNTCPPPGACDKTGKFCQCEQQPLQLPPASGYICDGKTHQFRAFICHTKNSCQQIGKTVAENCNGGAPKDCCIPGTDQPIASEVCGQCNGDRSADSSVYCSCRCDVAPGQMKDPNFNFCTCPTGFECKLIRPFEGLGDAELAGSYCIKSGTEFDSTTAASTCTVPGHFNSTSCSGSSTAECGG
jgi:hypothetical protein